MLPEFRLIQYRSAWAIEYYEDGRRYRRSTGTSDKAEAQGFLRAFVEVYEREHRPDRITVEYAWEGYRAKLGTKPAATTMGYEWKSVGPHFGHLFADEILERDCESYIAKRRAQHRSDGTIWTELGRLRSALKWAESKGLIVKSPTIYRPERPAPRDKRMTRAEVVKFLEGCDLPHVKLFVTLAMTTGARMGAILDLKWDRIDFERGLIILTDPDRAKTNKGRATVPMNKMARTALEAAHQGATTPYVIEWGGHRVRSIKKAIQGAGKRSGLPWVTAHVFRHSAACHMAEGGVPMAEIAQFLGHSDSRLTERVYARFSPKYLGKAANALEYD